MDLEREIGKLNPKEVHSEIVEFQRSKSKNEDEVYKLAESLDQGNVSCAPKDEFFRVFTECPALLEQVPATFFFGTTPVELSCFDVSSNYFVFGSSCGAIFVYNRRLSRSTTPLRTNYDEVVISLRLFAGTNDMLAIGHESGILVLLRFPSISDSLRRKTQQHIDQKLHDGHGITCIEWNEAGTYLYSADRSGVVFATKVNFDDETFESHIVCDAADELVQMSYLLNYLAIVTRVEVFVVSLRNDIRRNELQRFQIDDSELVSICLLNVNNAVCLYVGSISGNVYQYDVSTGKLLRSINLSCQVENFNEFMDKKVRCNIYRYGGNLLYYCSRCLVLLSVADCFKILTTYHIKELEVEQLVVDETLELAVYFLTKNKKVFRISSKDAPQSLRIINERPREFDPLSLISSIQKTTKLLPLAPTKAIFDRLRLNGDQALLSLPNITLPIIGNVLLHTVNVMKSSNSNSTNASDENVNGTDSHTDGRNLEMAQSVHAQSWLQNVNEVSKYFIDVVGGAGVPVREGFFPDEISSLPNPESKECMKFPEEVHGSFDEVLVQRSKKAVCKRRLDDSLPSVSGLETNCGGLDNSSFIDDALLDNIRQALSTVCGGEKASVRDVEQTENAQRMNKIALHGSDIENSQFSISSNTALGEQQKEPEELTVDGTLPDKNMPRSSTEIALVGSNAYEDLVKKALENKPTRFKTLSEDIQYFDGDFNDTVSFFNDKGDIWSEIRLPFPCSTFSVTSKYFLFCGFKKGSHPRYILLSDLMEGRWSKLKQKAELIVMNDENSLVWRIYNGVAYAPNELSSSPIFISPQWHAVANDINGIAEVALTSNAAWYATNSGQIYAQLMLPEMGIISRCESPWRLRSITASKVAVWALQSDTGRLVVRAGLKHFPFGIDWVEVEPEGPSRLLNIYLFAQTGWALDSNYCVWFTNGVDFNSPFGTSGIWLQVCSPWTIWPEIIRSHHVTANIRVSSFGIFVNIGRKVYWTSSKSPITGHSFKNIVPEKFSHDNFFEMISAGSLNMNDFDFISLCRKNELYLFRMRTRNFNSLPSIPSFSTKSVVQICAVGNTLYVLDNSGCIYVKSDLGKIYPFGAEWRLMDTGQCDSPIKSFAATNCSIWVVTADNCIYMHSRSQILEPCLGEKVSWNRVKFHAQPVDQIRASKCGTYVWIYASCSGHAWVRTSVNSKFPNGRTWLEASPEVNIVELAVGSKIVWSLSSSGQLFKLRGLTTLNPAGVYWKPVPKRLKAISLDAHDNLWGLDMNNRLIYHKVEVYPCSFDRTPRSLQKLLSMEEEDNDFLII